MREPPCNIEAEQALLGALLVSNAAFERVDPILVPEDFSEGLHAQIYSAIASRVRRGQVATPITLKDHFADSEPVTDGLPVWRYLGRLAANAVTIINVKDYAQTVRDLSLRRSLILLGEDLVNAAYDAAIDHRPGELIEDAEQRLFALAEPDTKSSELGMDGAISQSLEMADAAYKRGGKLSGLSTGLVDLDKTLGGLGATDVLVIAGRPSMGKTALACNIAVNVAKSEHTDDSGEIITCPVGIFSMEMSAEQLATRILAQYAEISSDKIRRGDFDETGYRSMLAQSKTVAGLPIRIDETGGLTIASLSTRARRMKRQHGIGLFIVDYLQLMSGGSKKENRTQEITEITKGLKTLAKELRTPVIALSQLSRDVEKRSDKRPQLSDLRESGSIEQDADVVMFVYRDEYYLSREEPDSNDSVKHSDWQRKMADALGKAELIIGKNRHGETGIRKFAFDSKLTRFSDLASVGGRNG